MSLQDIRAINWKHVDLHAIPQYIVIGFSIIVFGIILLVIGLFL